MNTVELLIVRTLYYSLHTPLFRQKMLIFILEFIIKIKNLLFVQQKRKDSEMAFLTSRSANKHVLFALGVDPTAKDAMN